MVCHTRMQEMSSKLTSIKNKLKAKDRQADKSKQKKLAKMHKK